MLLLLGRHGLLPLRVLSFERLPRLRDLLGMLPLAEQTTRRRRFHPLRLVRCHERGGSRNRPLQIRMRERTVGHGLPQLLEIDVVIDAERGRQEPVDLGVGRRQGRVSLLDFGESGLDMGLLRIGLEPFPLSGRGFLGLRLRSLPLAQLALVVPLSRLLLSVRLALCLLLALVCLLCLMLQLGKEAVPACHRLVLPPS